MFVQIKELQYWKTEHKDLNGCQDAYGLKAPEGLFVVADGAGTTLFPAIWARVLAQHFIEIPLMSQDPFEIEWWVRLAQEKYKDPIAGLEKSVDWNVLQKALNQGSDATLASLRISRVEEGLFAHAELLVFGDSCILTGKPSENPDVTSFVLQHPSDFDKAPICVPSALKFFNRSFHKCSIKSVTLEPGEVVILATDAVSKWILSGGNGHYEVWEAFQKVYSQTKESWPGFIDECRRLKQMIDDDSTALILLIKKDGDTQDSLEPDFTTDKLGSTTEHNPEEIEKRKRRFEEVQDAGNEELVAIYYGDGKDLASQVTVKPGDIEQARKVADALKEVLRAFRQAQNTPGLAAKLEPVWRQYGHLLLNASCADNIRATLERNGVNLKLAGPSVPAPPPVSTPPPPLEVGPDQINSTNYNTIPYIPPSPTVQDVPQEIKDRLSKLEAEKKQWELENAFLKAIHANKDDAILMAFHAIQDSLSQYPNLLQFIEGDISRVQLAEKRQAALQKFRKALTNGLVEEIEAEYDPVLDISDLAGDERKRLAVAQHFMGVLRGDDDDTILSAYEEIRADYQSPFTFTPLSQERIKAAQQRKQALEEATQQRKQALEKFQEALATRRLQDIVRGYNSVLDDYQHLTPSEREQLRLAASFVQAYTDTNDDAIVMAYNSIQQSAYMQDIDWMVKEDTRIKRAQQNVKSREIVVATVKGRDITIDQVRKALGIRKHYIDSLISYAQKAPSDLAQKDREWIEWQKLMLPMPTDPEQLPLIALDELVEDTFIQEGIKEAITKFGVYENYFDLPKLFSPFSAYFKEHEGDNYDVLLKSNRLTENDLEEILSVFQRRTLFAWHLHTYKPPPRSSFFAKQKPIAVDLNSWIENAKQKKKVAVAYNGVGASDPNKRLKWLSELLNQSN